MPHYDCPYHDVSKFTWASDNTTLMIDASDFGPVGTKWYGAPYADTQQSPHVVRGSEMCFVLRGKYREILFMMNNVHMGAGGDVTEWMFVPCERHLRLHPEDRKFSVRVFND